MSVQVPESKEVATVYGDAIRDQVMLEDYTSDQFMPAPNTILVKPVPPATVTKGGINLPSSAQKEQLFGHVAAIPKEGCFCKPGDMVVFRSPGTVITLGDGDFAVLQNCGGIDDEIVGHFST